MKQHFIDNLWVAPASGGHIPVINPSHGTVFGHVARGNSDDIDLAVRAARTAFDGAWGRLTATERGRLLQKLSESLLQHMDELVQLESQDCGKPTNQARADVNSIARYFEFYAGAADKLMGETIPYQNGYTVFTIREPQGVTGHIVPWNYPMQIFGQVWEPRWQQATPVWSSRRKTRACRFCAWLNLRLRTVSPRVRSTWSPVMGMRPAMRCRGIRMWITFRSQARPTLASW